MNEMEKCRIRLSHWKDHNVDHVTGYEEVARTLELLGKSDAAEMIRRGISFVESANLEFEKALAALASTSPAGEMTAQSEANTAHHHSHPHEHHHAHDHEHSHQHLHAHGHDHDHEHEHEHEHCGRHHHAHSESSAHASSDTEHKE